jgi:hypothetical protein
VQAITDDFSWLREFQGESSDSGPDDHFGSQMLGVQEGFGKVGSYLSYWSSLFMVPSDILACSRISSTLSWSW